MGEYVGYIIQVKNLEKHPNADKLQLLNVFGTTTAVSLDVKVGDIGIYFSEGLKLSDEMCQANDLVRRKDEANNPAGGFLEPGKQNIKTIRLRGAYSDGLYLPLSSLAFTGAKLEDFKVGDKIDVVNGIQICTKYIPHINPRSKNGGTGNGTRKKKETIAPLFAEHADTEQLVYHLDNFNNEDVVEITLKMHGTSARTGYLPVLKGYNSSIKLFQYILNKYWNSNKSMNKFIEKIYNRALKYAEPIYEYDYISGTRRTVLEDYEGGYYGSNAFRAQHSKLFEGKLHKGETVYGEIVGFTDEGIPIMPSAKNKSVGDDFVKQYGDITEFSYGCYPSGKKTLKGIDNLGDTYFIEEEVPKSKFYLYRMTYTSPEGQIIEYSPEYMRLRAEQMNVECVPVLWRGIIPKDESNLGNHDHNDYPINAGEWIMKKAEEYYDGPDPIGKNHIREGVVIRIISKPNQFCAFKHKNRSFKILAGIAVDNVTTNGEMDSDRLAEV